MERVPGVCQQRAANLRMVALASAVALAIVLPLAAATAGPAGLSGRAKTGPDKRQGKQDPARGRQRARAAGAASPAAEGESDARPDGGPGSPLAAPADGSRGSAAQCGPELDSPEGLEAQTCVLADGDGTWARTYYRNGTGGRPTGVLTLMAPDGRTLEVRCPMSATGTSEVCETPRRASLRGHGAYTAVAEIVSEQGKLLLRSGSNSPVPTAD